MCELQCPPIFAGGKDYVADPEALEAAHATFNEEGLYQAIAELAAKWHEAAGRKPRVLDLCAATGLCALRVMKTIPVDSVTLVDTSAEALRKGAPRFPRTCPLLLQCRDAVEYDDPLRYDLILMNSAYHHIQDERKVAFLRNARRLMSTDAVILIGEHFVGPYSSKEQYRQQLVAFYEPLIEELRHRGEPEDAVRVVRQAGFYGWSGDIEYKASFDVFSEHMLAASLEIQTLRTVWSPRCPRCAPGGPVAMAAVGSVAMECSLATRS